MIEFNSNTVFVDDDTQCAFIDAFKRRVCKRPALFIRDFGCGGQFLKIIPECASAKTNGNGRESPHGDIHCVPKDCFVHLVAECCGKTEKVIPFSAFCGGIDFCGVIQPHPAKLAFVGKETV